MSNNARLNLNGVFGFQKLLVGNTDVEPKIKDNSADITYIYNRALTSLQSQILTTVSNAFNASEVIIAINNTLTTFQTNLSSLTTKEASDVSSLQGQINSNYTTLDDKYKVKVNSLTSKQTELTTKQTDLESRITTLSNQQTNNSASTSSANTWYNVNVFRNGLIVTGGETRVDRDMTIGDDTFRFLTVNSMAVFHGGLRVQSGTVYFPPDSINASCIKNLSTNLYLTEANEWTQLQTFTKGITVSSGNVSIVRDTTIGANSNRLLTVNSSAIFKGGLKVESGTISIPDASIPIQAVDNLSKLLNDLTTLHWNLYGYVMDVLRIIPNTWKDVQTFSKGITVTGGTITVPNRSLPIAAINGLSTQLTNIQSSITSQVTKEASDISGLQLQINTLSSTSGATGPKGDKGDTGAP